MNYTINMNIRVQVTQRSLLRRADLMSKDSHCKELKK